MNDPSIDIWLLRDAELEEGKIGIIIRDASVIEHDGELVPGLALTIPQAITLSQSILEHVSKHYKDGEDGDDR